jgi:hypothetical protein
MEILIIGGALVALMVYVSTRIKKSAASAYERETIETEEFSIIKPENFINPIGENSEFAFTALSKDFGTGEAEEFRQAQAELRVYSNADFDQVRRTAEESTNRIISEETSESGNERICFLNGEKIENEIERIIFYKIVESKTRLKVYELNVSVLSEFKESYSIAANELLKSFTVN